MKFASVKRNFHSSHVFRGIFELSGGKSSCQFGNYPFLPVVNRVQRRNSFNRNSITGLLKSYKWFYKYPMLYDEPKHSINQCLTSSESSTNSIKSLIYEELVEQLNKNKQLLSNTFFITKLLTFRTSYVFQVRPFVNYTETDCKNIWVTIFE